MGSERPQVLRVACNVQYTEYVFENALKGQTVSSALWKFTHSTL